MRALYYPKTRHRNSAHFLWAQTLGWFSEFCGPNYTKFGEDIGPQIIDA